MGVSESRMSPRSTRPLAGEDIATTHWEDAHHWLSIYADLLNFKRGILARIRQDIATLRPEAQVAASEDVRIVEAQMQSYEQRHALWTKRAKELRGLFVDPGDRTVRHGNRSVALTNREFQLTQLLLDHPHRYFTTAQILGQAWSEPALSPEEVRNYVQRVRKILVELEAPAEVINKPGRGYSLVFRVD
jgi:DNA-binding response OmpR family regulator